MTEETPTLTDADRAYFAAVVDTKGRVDFIRQKKNGKTFTSAALAFDGLKEGVRHWIARKFPSVRAKKRGKGGVVLYLLGLEAAAALVAVKPWLTAMRTQAIAVVQFAGTRQAMGVRNKPETVAVRVQVERAILDLKKAM